MKRVLQYIGVVALNGILLLASAYLVWGWITLSDIRSKCEKKGYDFDAVMSSLISSPSDLMTLVNLYSGTNIHPAGTNLSLINTQFVEFGRYGVHFLRLGSDHTTTEKAKNGTNEITVRQRVRDDSMGGFIEPFAFMSDNFVNLLFCLGIGYLMSSTLLLLKLLKNTTLSIRYIVLRPVAGSLVGGCLFILVLSGGALFWTNASHVSGLSIGVLAAFGAAYCERFERVLKKGLSQSAKPERHAD